MKYNKSELAAIEKAKWTLVDCQSTTDHEIAHHVADLALLDLLSSLGMNDVVSEFKRIKRCYA